MVPRLATVTAVTTSTPNIEATVQASIAATVAARPTDTPVPTSTPTPTPSPTPLPTPTPTPNAHADSHPPRRLPPPTPTMVPTATLFPTWTPRPTFTPRPTATPRPTNTPLPSLKFDRRLLAFGPQDGTLTHEPDDGFLEVVDGPNARDDVLIEAVFINPHASDVLYWEHGFLFKDQGRNHQYWVSINSYGEWKYFHRLGTTAPLSRHSEESPDIDRKGAGGATWFRW